ncbi:MAG: sulfite reductase subunit alpha, partial [Planctomycetota bacterium]
MSELMKLVPDSAPFNDEQRAWLNGFLAGWVGMQGGDLGAGMVNGTALLDAPAEAVEEEEEDFDWHDPGVPMEDRLEATKDKPLKRKLMAAMAQLDCGACGYLCQTYSEAIASGEESDLTLCSPGGKETSKMVKKLLKESGGAEEAGGGAAAAAPAETGWSRKNPFPAKLVRGFNLNGEGSAKYTTHVEIDLEGSGLEYVVGDSLGVYPTNCEDLVADIAGAVGLNGEVTPALKSEKDLTDVSEELLEVLEKSTKDLGEKIKIKGWLSDDSKLEGMDVLDVLRSVPKAKPSGEDFLDSLSPLKPRLYSISSSPKAHPGQVHLTVGRVSWAAGERTRKGVASTMLADRVDEGAEVKVFVHKS